MLARTIGDGTAGAVLKQDCPQAGYATCRYVKDLPLTSQEFLWNSSRVTAWIALPLDERAAVAKEQNNIVLKALARYPIEQILTSSRNAYEQLGALDLTEFERNDSLDLEVVGTELASDMERFRVSPIWMRPMSLDTLASIWKLFYFFAVALAIVGVLMAGVLKLSLSAEVKSVLGWLMFAVLISTTENGVLSGVFGRYGARISWLPMFAACVIICAGISQRIFSKPAQTAAAT